MGTKPIITKLSEEINYWNILLYADSGAGKTVFAGSDNKVLFIAPEDDGLISAQRVNANATVDKITVKQWEDLKNAYEWFADHPEDCEPYNVFAIDSITEMQNLAKNYVLRMTADEKLRKGQDPEKMQLQDYGMMHELMENLVRGFNDLPVNVLWTATAKKVEDADGNEFLVPELQGKKDYGISMKMVALMTSYGYMRTEVHDVAAPTDDDPKAVKKVKRRVIYWEDTGTIRGKDRTVSLAPFTVNMTLQQMRRTINGEFVRGKDGKITKPVSDAVAPKKATVRTSPKAVKAVESKQSVAQPTEPDKQEEVASLELDAVEA